MTEYEFLKLDRIQKIKSINEEYDLLNNSYVSFSGGKDSLAVSLILDDALPNNQIPRVFINTGIEYKQTLDYVRKLSENDDRIKEILSNVNIIKMLNQDGYPFKSKQHSHNLHIYQNSGMTKTNLKYLGMADKTNFLCPEMLKYQFTPDFKIKVSDKCCYKLKKDCAKKWQKENNKSITITGIRSAEGGLRNYQHNCITARGNEIEKFHPLKPVDDNFIEMYLKEKKAIINPLYSSPYNFKRTGCLGCPFNIQLKKELEILLKYNPIQAYQSFLVWSPVYEEYARLNYRIDTELLNKIKAVKK